MTNTTNNDYNYNNDMEEEYDYNISFLRTSCENCWIIFDINKVAGVYRIKDNTLSLCDVCYFKIRNEHTNKRGVEWNGIQTWQRLRENPNFR